MKRQRRAHGAMGNMDFLRQLFRSGDFTPHGYCYLWNPGLVWLNVISDGVIALAYFTIPVALVWFIRKRRDVPFSWMYILFSTFIIACGAAHTMEVWNLWHAQYWLAGVIKAVAAVASIVTAYLLFRLIPKALEYPSSEQWIQATSALQTELDERRQLELDLRISEARHREIAELLDLTHDAIFVKNLKNEIIFWNRGAERLYGWRNEEARGKICHSLLQTVFPKTMEEIKAELFENGSWEGELVHRRRDGTTVTVSSRWAVRTDPGGNPIAILESNRDVTQRHREQEKFRNLLEAAPDAIVIVDGNGLIQIVNAQTEKFFGYAREEVLGQPVEVLVPEGFSSLHADHRNHYLESPASRPMSVGLQLHGRRKDGTEFPVEISLSPLETEGGTLISSAIRDVTDRRLADQALRESEERLKLTLESGRVGIWELDLATDTSVRSARHDEIFGYPTPVAEWGAKIFMTHVLPEDLESVKASFDAAYSTDILSMECRIKWPDESVHWISAQGRLYRDNHGKPARMRGVVTDVTARKQAEEVLEQSRMELARSNSELAAVNRELESFSYSVSHDLRAPLRHIAGFAQILKDDHGQDLSKEILRLLDRILHSTDHMGRLVDDLLNLARIGRQALTLRKVRLDDVVRQAMADLPEEAQNRNIEWRIEPLPEMVCDKGLLKLVFSNLLANAVKFTRKRELALIEIGVNETGGKTEIFVRDNGAGFDPKYADKLFGAFQRLHRQEDFEGTGIGLATVQRIIHRHAGIIRAESKPDHGTTFYFTLGPQAGSTAPIPMSEVMNGK